METADAAMDVDNPDNEELVEEDEDDMDGDSSDDSDPESSDDDDYDNDDDDDDDDDDGNEEEEVEAGEDDDEGNGGIVDNNSRENPVETGTQERSEHSDLTACAKGNGDGNNGDGNDSPMADSDGCGDAKMGNEAKTTADLVGGGDELAAEAGVKTPLQLGLQITIPQTTKATGAVAFLTSLGSKVTAHIPTLPKDGRSWAERTSPRADDPPPFPAGRPSFMPVANPPNLMQVAKVLLNTITPSAVRTPKPPPTGKLAIGAPGRRSSRDKGQMRKTKSPYKPPKEHSPVRISVDTKNHNKQQKKKPQSVQQDTGNHHSIGAIATLQVTTPVRPLPFGGGGQL